MLSDELLLTLSVYPLLFLMGWFYWNWNARAQKLSLIEPISKRKKMIFRFASLRIGSLFLWGAVEIFGAALTLFKYLQEDFNPFAFFWPNSETADISRGVEPREELLYFLRRLPALHGSGAEHSVCEHREPGPLAPRALLRRLHHRPVRGHREPDERSLPSARTTSTCCSSTRSSSSATCSS